MDLYLLCCPRRALPQAGSHFDEDQQPHLEGGKAVEFSKLPTSEEEGGSSAGSASPAPKPAAAP